MIHHFQTKSHTDLNIFKHPFSEGCFHGTQKEAVTFLLIAKISPPPWWDRFISFCFVLIFVGGLLRTGIYHRKVKQIFFFFISTRMLHIDQTGYWLGHIHPDYCLPLVFDWPVWMGNWGFSTCLPQILTEKISKFGKHFFSAKENYIIHL